MKNTKTQNSLRKLFKGLLLIFTLASSGLIKAQLSYSFTSAGATGNFGPTQMQLDSAYASTNLVGLVESTAGIQTWTVPLSGFYRIETRGAQGGGQTPSKFGGMGTSMVGDFNLSSGTVLKILVGQEGSFGSGCYGGGGGSFVSDMFNTPLIVAGGGGGAGGLMGGNGIDACIGLNGTAGVAGGAGGINGNGGNAINTNAGSGGGFYSDGTGVFYMPQCSTSVGRSFLNGGNGGQFDFWLPGGFGGGGSGWDGNGNGGGGGGYSGGGTSGTSFSAGGGAGSYNSGSNQINTSGVNSSDGIVIITPLSTITGINNLQPRNFELNIFPNPFTNKISIITSGKEKKLIQIFNALGYLISSINTEDEKTEINLSEEANGIYFVKMGSITKKIIKE